MGDASENSELEGFRDPKNKRKRRYVAALTAFVLPALLAGIFSLIPNLFDRFTQPEASLSYSVILSPSIKTASGFSRIFSLTIENSGTTRITGVQATFNFPGGAIERTSLGDGNGDRPQIGTADDGGRLTVRSMFPKERIAVTALATSANPSAKPTINVRSDQALGAIKESRDDDSSDSAKWSAIAAALGALIATIYAFISLKSDRNDFASSYLSSVGAVGLRDKIVVDRDEAIMYISDLVKVDSISDRLTRLSYNVKYVQFADMLADSADKSRGDTRSRSIAGLKAILLVPYLQAKTIKVVEDYLDRLGCIQPYILCSRDEIKDRHIYRDFVRRTFVSEGLNVGLTDEAPTGRFKRLFGRLAG